MMMMAIASCRLLRCPRLKVSALRVDDTTA